MKEGEEIDNSQSKSRFNQFKIPLKQQCSQFCVIRKENGREEDIGTVTVLYTRNIRMGKINEAEEETTMNGKRKKEKRILAVLFEEKFTEEFERGIG